jgi:enoyl-CoA hydratase/carnithine racemase
MAILEREATGAVMHLRMNAPERLNALSDEMIAAVHGALDEVAQDTSVRAVILSGAGKAFCAGHDLKQMTAGRQNADGGAAYFKDLFDRCAAMMARIQSLPQPVIAQVHGIATAAGCQMVATCDLAIAAHGTRFGVNGVNIGLFCSTPMVALSRNIPRKQAFEMLTTGDFIEAERAATLGLINHAVDPDTLETETQALAQQLAAKLGKYGPSRHRRRDRRLYRQTPARLDTVSRRVTVSRLAPDYFRLGAINLGVNEAQISHG